MADASDNLLHYSVSGDLYNVEAINPAGKRVRAKLSYVGALRRDYLLFIYPDHRRWGDMYSVTLPGCTLVGRCVDERRGKIVAFRTQVHSIVTHPTKLLCTEFPQEIQERSIRTGRRIVADIPVKCHLGEKEYNSTLLDISRGGGLLALEPDDEIKQGAELQLELKYEQEQTQKEVRVCSVKQQSGLLLVGLAFTEPMEQKDEQIALNLLWQES